MEQLVTITAMMVMAVVIYFSPTIIAFIRDHDRWTLIALLNVSLGWTGTVWLGLFVWACFGENRVTAMIHLSELKSRGHLDDDQYQARMKRYLRKKRSSAPA